MKDTVEPIAESRGATGVVALRTRSSIWIGLMAVLYSAALVLPAIRVSSDSGTVAADWPGIYWALVGAAGPFNSQWAWFAHIPLFLGGVCLTAYDRRGAIGWGIAAALFTACTLNLPGTVLIASDKRWVVESLQAGSICWMLLPFVLIVGATQIRKPLAPLNEMKPEVELRRATTEMAAETLTNSVG